MTPSAVSAENRLVINRWDSYFCDIVTDRLGFPTQLSVTVYHYIYFRFHVARLDLTSTWLVLRLPALYAFEAKI